MDYEAKGKEFVARMDEVMNEVFDMDEDKPMVVLGFQAGPINDDDPPPIFLSGNVPVCVMPDALRDLYEMAVERHREYHAEDGEHPLMTQDEEDVPEEVREFAQRLAADLGVSVKDIVYRGSVSTDDLNDEGIAGLIGEPMVMTGDDDISDPEGATETKYGNAPEEEDPEQRFESGSENEG